MIYIYTYDITHITYFFLRFDGLSPHASTLPTPDLSRCEPALAEDSPRRTVHLAPPHQSSCNNHKTQRPQRLERELHRHSRTEEQH